MADNIERKYLAHFVDAALSTEDTPNYTWLGDDLEEYSVEMSAQVDKKKNIKGVTSVRVSSYEKSGSVEPYYASKTDPMSARLLEIIDNELTLDDCNTTAIEVKLWDATADDVYPATREKAVIEVSSYGGDTTGIQIPFNLHYCGGREQGTFNIKTKTFTPKDEVVAQSATK